MKTVTAKLTISRGSDDIVRIRISDKYSGVQIIETGMTPHDFAMAVTGLARVEAQATVYTEEIQHIGKQYVREERHAEAPRLPHDHDAIGKWLLDNCQEPGWSVDPYVNSQGSIRHDGDKTFLRYHVYKYVDIEEEGAPPERVRPRKRLHKGKK